MPGMKPAFPYCLLITALCAADLFLCPMVHSAGPMVAQADSLLRVESGPAVHVVEKIRANRPGTVVEIYVKLGDAVKKGQILGHTELAAVKLNKDLAEVSLDTKGGLDEKYWQREAWRIQREETEEAVRKRQAPKSRLDWATSMEKLFEAQYSAQQDAKKVAKIMCDFHTQEYEERFFRATVDGIVTELPVLLGQAVNYATHVATISNDSLLSVPVTLPVSLAESAERAGTVLVRSPNGRSMIRAVVDSLADDPAAPGERKIARLLINDADVPPPVAGQKADGMKFDVFVPKDSDPR